MRKGIEPIEDQVERVSWSDGYEYEHWREDQELDRASRVRPVKHPERSRCICAPWAVNGWDGPEHDCPEHGCSPEGSWP